MTMVRSYWRQKRLSWFPERGWNTLRNEVQDELWIFHQEENI
jgi:hypothetical protein